MIQFAYVCYQQISFQSNNYYLNSFYEFIKIVIKINIFIYFQEILHYFFNFQII